MSRLDDIMCSGPLVIPCHYCGVPVANRPWVQMHGTYRPAEVRTDHCGCGKHDIEAGDVCVYPGGWVAPEGIEWLCWDHKTAKSRGGSDEPSNLVPCCFSCNSRKGAKDYDDFIRQVR